MGDIDFIEKFKSLSNERGKDDDPYYVEYLEHLRESIKLFVETDKTAYNVVRNIVSGYEDNGKAVVFHTLKEVINQWSKDDKVIYVDEAKCFLVFKDETVIREAMCNLKDCGNRNNCKPKKYQIINASEPHKFFLVFSATLENDEELIKNTQQAIKKIFDSETVETICVDDDTITFSIPNMTMGNIPDNKMRFSRFMSEAGDTEITSRCQNQK